MEGKVAGKLINVAFLPRHTDLNAYLTYLMSIWLSLTISRTICLIAIL